MRTGHGVVIVVVAWCLFGCSAAFSKELTADSCREKNLTFGITKGELADCIEGGLYDPCDDATGKAGAVNCYVGHVEVAKRRIEKATKEITDRMHKQGVEFRGSVREGGVVEPPRNYLVQANKFWSDYVWEQCLLINALDDKFEGFESAAACELRLYRQRADELDAIQIKVRN